MLIDGCWQFVGGWWLRLRRLLFWMGVAWLWSWWWAFVVWLEDLWIRGVGQGSSILPSVARSSRVLRAHGGRRGRGRLGRLVRFGIGVVFGAFGAAGRWVECVLGDRDSIHCRVAIG